MLKELRDTDMILNVRCLVVKDSLIRIGELTPDQASRILVQDFKQPDPEEPTQQELDDAYRMMDEKWVKNGWGHPPRQKIKIEETAVERLCIICGLSLNKQRKTVTVRSGDNILMWDGRSATVPHYGPRSDSEPNHWVSWAGVPKEIVVHENCEVETSPPPDHCFHYRA